MPAAERAQRGSGTLLPGAMLPQKMRSFCLEKAPECTTSPQGFRLQLSTQRRDVNSRVAPLQHGNTHPMDKGKTPKDKGMPPIGSPTAMSRVTAWSGEAASELVSESATATIADPRFQRKETMSRSMPSLRSALAQESRSRVETQVREDLAQQWHDMRSGTKKASMRRSNLASSCEKVLGLASPGGGPVARSDGGGTDESSEEGPYSSEHGDSVRQQSKPRGEPVRQQSSWDTIRQQSRQPRPYALQALEGLKQKVRQFGSVDSDAFDASEDSLKRQVCEQDMWAMPSPSWRSPASKKLKLPPPPAKVSGWFKIGEAFLLHNIADASSLPLAEVRRAFALFKDHSIMIGSHLNFMRCGGLDKLQFKSVVAKLADIPAHTVPEASVNLAFKQADTDGNCKIDFTEFAFWLGQHSFSEFMTVTEHNSDRSANRDLCARFGMNLLEVENYRREFTKFDSDGNGTIDKEEFKGLISEITKLKIGELPASRVRMWWRSADLDGNGDIDFEEFIMFYRKYFQGSGNGRALVEDYYRAIAQHMPGQRFVA